MRAYEFITELFDRSIPGRVVRATADLFTTRATIGSRDILFNTAFYDKNGQRGAEVDFVEKTPGNTSFSKTGSGNEMDVFGFVIESLKEMIASYHPEFIEFNSWQGDKNRTKLYIRMIKRYAPALGYHLAEVIPGTSSDYFVINKNTDK